MDINTPERAEQACVRVIRTVDTVVMLFEFNIDADARMELQRTCGSVIPDAGFNRRNHLRVSDKSGVLYRAKYYFHQPTAGTVQVLNRLISSHRPLRMRIHGVHIAFDFVTRTQRKARWLNAVFQREFCKARSRAGATTIQFKGTQYWGPPTMQGVNCAMYVRDGRVRDGEEQWAADGGPGARVELRFQGVGAVRKYLDVLNPIDIFASRSKWDTLFLNHVRAYRIRWRILGRQLHGRVKSKNPRPRYRRNGIAIGDLDRSTATLLRKGWEAARAKAKGEGRRLSIGVAIDRFRQFTWCNARQAFEKVDLSPLLSAPDSYHLQTHIPLLKRGGVAVNQ